MGSGKHRASLSPKKYEPDGLLRRRSFIAEALSNQLPDSGANSMAFRPEPTVNLFDLESVTASNPAVQSLGAERPDPPSHFEPHDMMSLPAERFVALPGRFH